MQEAHILSLLSFLTLLINICLFKIEMFNYKQKYNPAS